MTSTKDIFGPAVIEPPEGDAATGSLPHSLHNLIALDRSAPHPLYLQIEEQIEALVTGERLRPGTTLPPERQLAEALGVSRGTVQISYNALRTRGLLGGRGRRGSVVQPSPLGLLATGMDRLKGFTQEMEEMGRIASTRVVECEVVTDRSMASIFGLRSEARFLRLVRIRYGDDQPLTVESAWYSLDIAPHLETADFGASMYDQLSRAGMPLSYCDQTIETAMPTEQESRIFDFAAPTPCLLIKRRSFVVSGAMVEYVEGLFRGDAYVYRVRLPA
ncbi:MAG TPA: GntR family transcriptional regulator [Sphingobium sp.]